MIQLTVTRTEAVTPVIRRVWFRSDDLSAFAESDWTDRYVKLQFPDAVRTYTALFPDVVAGTMAIDFVTHGDEGVAGPWASAAQPGDRIEVRGPGGAYRPDLTADWHLLAGDESAVPAITAALERLPADAVVRVVVLVEDSRSRAGAAAARGRRADRAPPRDAGRGTEGPEAQSLAAAVRALEWLPGRVHAFVHGEAAEVMHDIRPYLLKERGLDRDQVSISGYWRRGRSEEGFRQWKAELRASEGATV